jgi:cytidylate kinase
VDGPAASGKGTIASRLAAEYALPFLDTGCCTGRWALAVLAQGGDPADPKAAQAAAEALDASTLDPRCPVGRRAGEAASQAAAHPEERGALLDLQRAFAAQPRARCWTAATSAR